MLQLPECVKTPFQPGDFSDIIDVRAPSEFRDDHIPGAINLPVLSDEQRETVGKLHADNTFEARRLGATLITENIHQHLATTLTERERDFAPLIYCWRGNLRSNSMAIIFRAIGWRSRILQGGYKQWRKWLISDLDEKLSAESPELIVLGGLTGCGKTRLLHALAEQGAQILDLEGHACHKGSILGNPATGEQPSQKWFETHLWQDFQKFDPSRPVFTEAESNRIGKIHCPGALWKRLAQARVVQVNLPLPDRALFLAEDYPHFIEEPEKLKEKLNGLRRLRGHDQVDQWHRQIDENEWTAFLQSILVHHYDLVYRRPGSDESVYQEPEFHLELSHYHEDVFQENAAKLIQKYRAV